MELMAILVNLHSDLSYSQMCTMFAERRSYSKHAAVFPCVVTLVSFTFFKLQKRDAKKKKKAVSYLVIMYVSE